MFFKSIFVFLVATTSAVLVLLSTMHTADAQGVRFGQSAMVDYSALFEGPVNEWDQDRRGNWYIIVSENDDIRRDDAISEFARIDYLITADNKAKFAIRQICPTQRNQLYVAGVTVGEPDSGYQLSCGTNRKIDELSLAILGWMLRNSRNAPLEIEVAIMQTLGPITD